ncbi:TIM barrel protein [Mycolicibacterium neworleansense]|uniref:AP endonuclease, family protein 2 superfamily protein n=1 Tax=Mycolicibacterium neworleansense TaxID=146018 RepID=A0A0H5RXQ7_9MYCO|nr:TIM barrel protein [Mycolicibacterium neworleansense]MCV7362093.1 TIM barrel protein [Mycolicibacterium neworleansense]CRZ13499.1 AP endonuclease, family protein 2 superfamily protein [Mycolicibacterium neworleansense]
MTQTFELAVCAEMVFTDLDIVERARQISELGFSVEIWSFDDKDLDALAATGARFSSMTGYLHGDLYDADGAREVVRTAAAAIKAAAVLGVPRLVVHPGELVAGQAARPQYRATGEMWLSALRGLDALGELGADAGVTFCLENLNTIVDHPGVPLARAKDTLALIEAVNHPNVKMMLDLYHAQIGEGNLVDLVRRAGSAIGEIQVADVPGRCEPGTGEIHYPAVAKALRDSGYTGPVGMEAYASGDSAAALEAFRAAFS